MDAKRPGIKRNQVQKCALCLKPVGHNGDILFYRVSYERFGWERGAVMRRQGLETMFGGTSGAAALAGAMGPDEDLAVSLGHKEFLVCDPCAMESTGLMVAFDVACRREDSELRT